MRTPAAAATLGALLALQPARAEVVTDHQLWLNAAVRTEATDGLDVSFTQHVRMANNVQNVSQVIPQAELSYGGLKHVSFATGARSYFNTNAEGERSRALRLHGDLGLETPEMGPVEFAYRLRVQRTTDSEPDKTSIRVRHRGVLRVKAGSSLKPELLYEHFTDPNEEPESSVQKDRLGFGLGIRFDTRHRLKLKFFQDTEIDGDGDKERIASVGYRYDL